METGLINFQKDAKTAGFFPIISNADNLKLYLFVSNAECDTITRIEVNRPQDADDDLQAHITSKDVYQFLSQQYLSCSKFFFTVSKSALIENLDRYYNGINKI